MSTTAHALVGDTGCMGLWDRLRRRGSGAAAPSADEQHLRAFVASRDGVEGFVEPRTTVTGTTLLLVARDGEWTRRHVPTPEWAYAWARKQGIAVYDAAVTGLPARMREYNRRRKQEEKARLEQYLEGPTTD